MTFFKLKIYNLFTPKGKLDKHILNLADNSKPIHTKCYDGKNTIGIILIGKNNNKIHKSVNFL
jgi:hypothetical protein